MGIDFLVSNPDKKEFFNLGSLPYFGSKFGAVSDKPTSALLVWLLVDLRGFDLRHFDHPSPMLGRWFGSRVEIVGDEGQNAYEQYQHIKSCYRDITLDLFHEWIQEPSNFVERIEYEELGILDENDRLVADRAKQAHYKEYWKRKLDEENARSQELFSSKQESSLQIQSLFDQYVMPTYGRYPLSLVRGKGCRVWDANGKEYLDFAAGIAVCSIGHSHPAIAKALAGQAETLVHVSNLYLTEPQGLLAKRLVEIVGQPGKCFFCNSGGEANEALFKLARKFGHDTGGGRFEIITFQNSFHGRTLAGIAATGQEKVKKGFEPPVEGFIHVPFNDLNAVRAAVNSKTVAILIEPIQGESGITPAKPEFLRGLRQLCNEKNLLLMFDEVQCGLGRTGDWCAFKSLLGSNPIYPDAISWAKGIAGGVPMGAIWASNRKIRLSDGSEQSLCNLLGPGTHATTFGGTPLACSAALAVLDVIEKEGLLKNARDLGAYADSRLSTPEGRVPNGHAIDPRLIKEVRIVGLMIGIELAPDIADVIPSLKAEGKTPAALCIGKLHEAGLLAVPAGTHTIRWLPPLNTTKADVDEAVTKLRTALTSSR